jgi:PKD repeat protein
MKSLLALTIGLFILLFTSISVYCAAATPIYYHENGHYYDAIPANETGITWGEAKIEAETLSYKGMNGHLATITSQGENDFIVSNFGGEGYWLGGFQPEGSIEPDGGWQWITNETWNYTNWNPGAEPNNHYGGDETHSVRYPEDALQIRDNYLWNDYPNDIPMYGYIVEYETDYNTKPIAAFSVSKTLGIFPLTVKFIDESTGSPTSWCWNFGDGTCSTNQDPIHDYKKSGNYSVTLTVKNVKGQISKATKIIDLNSSSEINIDVGEQTKVELEDNSGSTGYSWVIGHKPDSLWLIDSYYISPEDPIPGKPGTRVFIFYGADKCQDFIQFIKVRLWDPKNAEITNYSVKIN